MSENKKKEFLLGGQAVIEGVMMRSPHYYAVAVRKPDGEILMRRVWKPKVTEKHPWLNIPILRGVVHLGQTLSIGISALNWSAEAAEGNADAGEDTRKGGNWQTVLSMSIAFIFAFALIVLLPLLLTDLTVYLLPGLNSSIAYNAVDGLYRMLFFLAYIWLISFVPDIRRVFQYHGAEHMAVYSSEKDAELNVDNASRHSPYHPRCGTSFLLFVMIIAIVVFSLTPHDESLWFKLFIRTPLIPVIAGVSYEVLRLTAALSGSLLFRMLSAPGLWLQRLTALHPDEDQLEVSVAALREVMDLEEQFHGKPLPEDVPEIIARAEPQPSTS